MLLDISPFLSAPQFRKNSTHKKRAAGFGRRGQAGKSGRGLEGRGGESGLATGVGGILRGLSSATRTRCSRFWRRGARCRFFSAPGRQWASLQRGPPPGCGGRRRWRARRYRASAAVFTAGRGAPPAGFGTSTDGWHAAQAPRWLDATARSAPTSRSQTTVHMLPKFGIVLPWEDLSRPLGWVRIAAQ